MHSSLLTSATEFVPLRDPVAEWDARLAIIATAGEFVYASTYYVAPDAYGLGFLQALAEAAGRGVSCTLLVDRFGQWLGASAWSRVQRADIRHHLERAERAGVRVVWTGASSRVRACVGGGHHVKIQLCERGPALFGSSNLSRHSFGQWGEFSALVSGPVVHHLLEALHRVIPTPVRHHVVAQHPAGTVPMRWLRCDPNADLTALAPLRASAGNPITELLVQAVAGARRSISLSTFYFKPVGELRAALLAAAERGVRVRVYHSNASALGGAETSWLAAAVDYGPYLDAGVRIYEVEGGEHSKLVYIDEQWAALGSYNWDHAAHDVVAEAIIASEAMPIVEAVGAVFRELDASDRTRPVDPRYRDSWGLRRRVHARLIGPVRRWV